MLFLKIISGALIAIGFVLFAVSDSYKPIKIEFKLSAINWIVPALITYVLLSAAILLEYKLCCSLPKLGDKPTFWQVIIKTTMDGGICLPVIMFLLSLLFNNFLFRFYNAYKLFNLLF